MLEIKLLFNVLNFCFDKIFILTRMSPWKLKQGEKKQGEKNNYACLVLGNQRGKTNLFFKYKFKM